MYSSYAVEMSVNIRFKNKLASQKHFLQHLYVKSVKPKIIVIYKNSDSLKNSGRDQCIIN